MGSAHPEVPGTPTVTGTSRQGSAKKKTRVAYVPPSSRYRLSLDSAADPVPASRETHSNVAVQNFVGVAPWLAKAGLSSWYMIGIATVIVAIIFGTAKISPVFMGIFIALVLKALLNPLVNSLSKFMKRWMAVVVSLLGFVAVFVGMLTFVVTSVAGQWSELSSKLGHGVDMIIEFLQSLPFNINLTSDDVYKWLQENLDRAQTYLQSNWERLATEALSNVGAIAIGFTVVFLAIFVAIFFLLSGAEMWRWFLNLLPTRVRAKTNTAAQAGWMAFAGYANGTVIIAVSDGALAWIFLEIVGIPLAPALGVLVLIGAFIPMVGAPAAMLVAMIVALAVDGVWKAVIVGVGIALIGQFEGHVLQPLVMGRQVSLSPVVVIIGVVSGTIVAGLVGAVIAVPLMGVAWAVFSALYHPDPPIKGPLPGGAPEEILDENPQAKTKTARKVKNLLGVTKSAGKRAGEVA